jgi:hypothetical protein
MSMTEFWNELHGNLKLGFDSSMSTELDAVARFSVSNTAHAPQSDWPEIVFENVVLTVGVPPDRHEIFLGSLKPEEAVVHEHRCTLSDLPDLEYSLTAAISSEAFFRRIQRGRFPGSGANLSKESYVRLFKEIDVHRWLNATLRNFSIPGPSSTLLDIQNLIQSLSQHQDEIREAGERLRRIATFLDSGDRISREFVTQHGNVVHPYLREVQTAITQLIQALGTPNSQKLSALLERMVANLDSQAVRVEEATEDLLK